MIVIEGQRTVELARDAVAAEIARALGQGLAPSWQAAEPPSMVVTLLDDPERVDALVYERRVPVLALRPGSRLVSWPGSGRALRLLVAVDFSSASEAALTWVRALAQRVPCEIQGVHIHWPFDGPLPAAARDEAPDIVHPAVEARLRRDLEALADGLPVTWHIRANYGRVDAALLPVIAEADPDLLVLGANLRHGPARFWRGSVGRGLLAETGCSVAVVPRTEELILASARRAPGRILVAVDFTPASERVVPAAVGLLAPGGSLHLVHVRERGEDAAAARAHLARLAARIEGVTVTTELLEGDVAAAIAAAADRYGADLVGLATRGRTAVAGVALGSVAHEIVGRLKRPMFLLPPARGD